MPHCLVAVVQPVDGGAVTRHLGQGTLGPQLVIAVSGAAPGSADETGIAIFSVPLVGSLFVESLASKREAEAVSYFDSRY